MAKSIKVSQSKIPTNAPVAVRPAKSAKSATLTDADYVAALNTRPDEDEQGNAIPRVTLANLWSECRAREVGHRSCRCGKDGCGNKS